MDSQSTLARRRIEMYRRFAEGASDAETARRMQRFAAEYEALAEHLEDRNDVPARD